MSVLHQNSGAIGKFIPAILAIWLDPQDFPCFGWAQIQSKRVVSASRKSFFWYFSKLWFVLDAVLGSRQGKAGVGGRHWWPLPAWWRLVGGGRWQASTWWDWQAWPLVAAGDLVAASTFGRSVNITHPSSPLHHWFSYQVRYASKQSYLSLFHLDISHSSFYFSMPPSESPTQIKRGWIWPWKLPPPTPFHTHFPTAKLLFKMVCVLTFKVEQI